MENALNNEELAKLRGAGLLLENEVALRSGDLIIAENVVTKDASNT